MSMLSPSLLRFALIPPMLLALSALAGLAVIIFRQALSAGTGEALMMAWVLTFVVGLPTLILLLGLAGWLRSRKPWARIIPLVGERIPETGQ